MWVLWMKKKRSMVVDDGRAELMLMRWCIRQETLKDKMGLLVQGVESVMAEWPDIHNN